MFAYIGSSCIELDKLYLALSESAKNDTIAKRQLGFSQHNDGWGYVISEQNGPIHHYRSEKPIYNDNHRFPRIEGNFSAIFHVRKASDKSTVRSGFSHPFFVSNEKNLIFFAHNGSLNDTALKKELGFGGITTDSEMAAVLFATRGMRAIDILEKNTKSALNLLIMSIDRTTGKSKINYKNYYKKKEHSELYDLYYQKFEYGRAIYSSTLNLFGMNGKKVEYGEFLEL